MMSPALIWQLLDPQIRGGNDKDSQEDGSNQAPDDDSRQWRVSLAPGFDLQSHRQQPENRCQRGHQDGPQTNAARMGHGVAHPAPFIAKPIREIDNQDTV